ncbi:MAG: mannose-6-phosphate isomerase, class I [Syntrophobacteraceae bacterium CG23_combo_of_CG06-09_8_20_14_all_50_8]|nr:MAG: mannose-6-phosphate isomerase, class I [Syntrophobacteraceae bacterium CG23_combo_of_CG06-09_8_20_14_all_50_8]
MDMPWRMRNRIMNSSWGSHTAIARLLGAPEPSLEPQAELWMGAHPKAPSMVRVQGVWVSLVDLIVENSESILGTDAARVFGNRLPFLFKVLAAEKPLSIQAHPNSPKAKEGFERENNLGIPLDSPRRSFQDDSPKPELLCALSPFWALCGFRKIPDILKLGNRLVSRSLKNELRDLKRQPDPSGLKAFFKAIMALEDSIRKNAIDEALASAAPEIDSDPVAKWITTLAREFPFDIGMLSPIFLNLFRLNPGEGIFLSAGILHAYLKGVGVELMANSDNVVRGGLTRKHVDLNGLMDILKFDEHAATIIRPIPAGSCEMRFDTPTEAFSLSQITVSPEREFLSQDRKSIEILLCVEGSGAITTQTETRRMSFQQGDSFLIPANFSGYRIKGDATLYKAFVPER